MKSLEQLKNNEVIKCLESRHSVILMEKNIIPLIASSRFVSKFYNTGTSLFFIWPYARSWLDLLSRVSIVGGAALVIEEFTVKYLSHKGDGTPNFGNSACRQSVITLRYPKTRYKLLQNCFQFHYFSCESYN